MRLKYQDCDDPQPFPPKKGDDFSEWTAGTFLHPESEVQECLIDADGKFAEGEGVSAKSAAGLEFSLAAIGVPCETCSETMIIGPSAKGQVMSGMNSVGLSRRDGRSTKTKSHVVILVISTYEATN